MSHTFGNTVSVVIASRAGGDFLFRCLDSLREQVATESAEVIVVDRCGTGSREIEVVCPARTRSHSL
jgi:glycosyltransferase involved in cell wall biosynthesis